MNDSDLNPVFRGNSACEIGAPMIAVYSVPSVKSRSIAIIAAYCVIIGLLVFQIVSLIVFWMMQPPLEEVSEREAAEGGRKARKHYTIPNAPDLSSTMEMSTDASEESSRGDAVPQEGRSISTVDFHDVDVHV
jgi:hypothetical protein